MNARAIAIGDEDIETMSVGKQWNTIGNGKRESKILTFKTHEGKTETVEVNQSKAYRFIKRLSDLVLSLLALIIFSPIFLLTAIAIKIDDHGPCMFKQDRSGLNGTVFSMYKFRSMRVGADKEHKDMVKYNELDGPAFKMKKDPRITKVGKFIRKTSIDELPQLVNVIKGEMSLVGPRPFPVYETEQCNEYQRQRMKVLPGLTCYWQVSGRNNITFDEWIEMDFRYIREASVKTDLKLLGMTVVAVARMIGAY